MTLGSVAARPRSGVNTTSSAAMTSDIILPMVSTSTWPRPFLSSPNAKHARRDAEHRKGGKCKVRNCHKRFRTVDGASAQDERLRGGNEGRPRHPARRGGSSAAIRER